MRVLNRKSRWQRVADPIRGPLAPRAIKSNLDGFHPPKAVKSGLSAVGGMVALTAGSAAVSSLRRRRKGSENHS